MNDHRWQHPAERAAESKPDLIVTAPPISKRLTALTAMMSLLASVIVLIVAVPKGIEDYREDAEEFIPTSVPVKSHAMPHILATAKSSIGLTSAVSVGNGVWVIALNMVSPGQDVTITTPSGSASVIRQVATFPESGISVLHCVASCTTEQEINIKELSDPRNITDFNQVRVVDAFSEQAMQMSPSVAMVGQSPDSPIHVDEAINGVAVALNEANTVVGIVVRKNHSNWLLGKENLDAIVNWVNKY